MLILVNYFERYLEDRRESISPSIVVKDSYVFEREYSEDLLEGLILSLFDLLLLFGDVGLGCPGRKRGGSI